MNITQQVIIMSAEKSQCSYAKNRVFTKDMEHMLKTFNFSFKIGLGSYYGDEETCFIIFPKSNSDLQFLKDQAFRIYGQESILYQDANGISRLEISNGKTKLLGRLKEYPMDKKNTIASYTIFNNQLWAV